MQQVFRRINKNEKGSVTVEMSLITPLLLLIVFLMIRGFVYVYDTELLRGKGYEIIYTASFDEEKEYMNEGTEKSENVLWTSESYEMSASRDTLSYKAEFDMKGSTEVITEKEYGVCTDRLRRWQVYGDLAD